MKWLNWITTGIISGTFVGWIAWDVYVATHGAKTESQLLAEWSHVSIVLPHLVGFLCGHWFFPRRNMWTSGWMWGLGIWGVLGIWDVVYHFYPTPWQTFVRFPLWWLVLGIPTGSYFWGQRDGSSPIP